MKYIALLSVLCAASCSTTGWAEPNPPQWPHSVSIFTPDMSKSDIEDVVNAAYKTNGGDPRTSCDNGHWSDLRFAFMFTPGTYNGIDVPIGYYTSAYGLGTSPSDTKFDGGKGIYSEQGCGIYQGGALSTFWRSAENFWTTTNDTMSSVANGMTWAVSQAAPLRNVRIDNDLTFFEYIPEYCCAAGYASGGFASGVKVGGEIKFGSQQQFFVRSSQASRMDTPVWNGVFAACINAFDARCGSGTDDLHSSVSVEPSMPLIAEKPYISATEGGKTFALNIPPVQENTSPGVAWTDSGFPGTKVVDFSQVYVTSETDTAAIINSKLDAGLHVVISPATYILEASIVINKPDTVVMGIGFATIQCPENGDPCFKVADVDGVRIASVLLQAGPWTTNESMLQVGESGTYAGSKTNPTVLSDIFVRVGGPHDFMGPVNDSMLIFKSGYTVLDNTWLWRADHTLDGGVYNGTSPVKHGLHVKADNVYTYGLAAEHTIEDNVLWEGDNGLTYFYQAEIMYDYTGDVWDHSCYTIDKSVDGHYATGLGCYSFFRDYDAVAPSGVNTNGAENVKIDKAASVWLNGVDGSGIENVINQDGLSVGSQQQANYECIQ